MVTSLKRENLKKLQIGFDCCNLSLMRSTIMIKCTEVNLSLSHGF